MFNIENLLILFTGIILTLSYDVAGSILSRNLNFHYGYFAPGSFLIYGITGYLVGTYSGNVSAASVTAIIGFVDSTVGWKISRKLNAKGAEPKDDETSDYRIIVSLMLTFLCAGIGYIAANYSI